MKTDGNILLVLLAVGVVGWLYHSNQSQLCQHIEAEYKAYQNAIKDARP